MGRYPGAAQNACNLQLRLSTTVSVVFHNLRGYESHPLMQAISKLQGNIRQLHSQQHAEVYPVLSCDSSTAFSSCKPRSTDWSKHRILPPHAHSQSIRARRRKVQSTSEKQRLSVRAHGRMGNINIPRTHNTISRCFLKQIER